MQSRRKFLGMIPAGLLGASAGVPLLHAAQQPDAGLTLTPSQAEYRPLAEITVTGAGTGRLVVLDGDGIAYVDRPATLPATFLAGCALGTQSVLLFDAAHALTGKASFHLDATTQISEPSGEFNRLLKTLLWTIASDGPRGARRHNGRIYTYWDDWLMDNTNSLKGMRYFSADVRPGFEIFSDTQREDGMIWENHIDRTPPENDWDRRFKYGDFSRAADGGFVGLRRAPVENHVEAYFLEAFYMLWKTTGDDPWMKTHLDRALHAVHYSTTDPYRWSTKMGLLKRGLTIDTWDFLCESEAALVGGDFMVIDLNKTHFGIFFGDNTGFIHGCRGLAEMLDVAGRAADAAATRKLAAELEERLNHIAWNGKFYTHWVAEDPNFDPALGVDMGTQVSLSNSYALNRGIAPGHAKAIIDTYAGIRKQMPHSSPGEFYSIFPPFPKGFEGASPMWSYVNGGVLACTAGELARGCFQHGYEEYGADILRRLIEICKRHRDFLPGILFGKQAERPPTHFTPLDLSSLANCDTGQGRAGVPGWMDEPNNWLIDFPSGAQTFRGVPFHVASAAENGGKVCVGLSTARGFARQAFIPMHQACASFYLLHACSGPGAMQGKLTIHYEDGETEVEFIERGVNVSSFWAPQDDEFNNRYGPGHPDRMQVAWRGASKMIENVGVWITGFTPRHADKPIAQLEFSASETGAKWLVIGATASDAPAFLPPWSDVSTGMPNNWGAGCVMAALLEGLAGAEDTGAGFRTATISPRWMAAGVDEAEVTVRFPASRGYVTYRYKKSGKRIALTASSCADAVKLRIMMPGGGRVGKAVLNGAPTNVRIERVDTAAYATATLDHRGVHQLELELI